MDIFYELHIELLKKLQEYEAEYLLIGGYAVNYHGFNRPTGDLDLWINGTEENKSKILKVLEFYQFLPESIDHIRNLDFSKANAFSFGEVPIRVDFLTKISGIAFEEAYQQKVIGEINGLQIPVLHLNHLILSKISNERTKDKMDVEELQKIMRINKK
jgi:hypothetical protein